MVTLVTRLSFFLPPTGSLRLTVPFPAPGAAYVLSLGDPLWPALRRILGRLWPISSALCRMLPSVAPVHCFALLPLVALHLTLTFILSYQLCIALMIGNSSGQ
jgi:hypothetical protein